MMFRYFNYVMILVFALSAAVQYNDEDPLLWILIYGAACLVSVLFAIQKMNRFTPIVVAGVSLLWALTIIPDLTMNGFQHMFGDVKMMQSGVKEAREFLGLFIIIAWMTALTRSNQKKSVNLFSTQPKTGV